MIKALFEKLFTKPKVEEIPPYLESDDSVREPFYEYRTIAVPKYFGLCGATIKKQRKPFSVVIKCSNTERVWRSSKECDWEDIE